MHGLHICMHMCTLNTENTLLFNTTKEEVLLASKDELLSKKHMEQVFYEGFCIFYGIS